MNILATEKSSHANALPEQQQAQLQAMGIDCYCFNEGNKVSEFAWLNDVCALLEITSSDCLYDAQTPYFDKDQCKLHLPHESFVTETEFKRLLWQSIRQYVS